MIDYTNLQSSNPIQSIKSINEFRGYLNVFPYRSDPLSFIGTESVKNDDLFRVIKDRTYCLWSETHDKIYLRQIQYNNRFLLLDISILPSYSFIIFDLKTLKPLWRLIKVESKYPILTDDYLFFSNFDKIFYLKLSKLVQEALIEEYEPSLSSYSPKELSDLYISRGSILNLIIIDKINENTGPAQCGMFGKLVRSYQQIGDEFIFLIDNRLFFTNADFIVKDKMELDIDDGDMVEWKDNFLILRDYKDRVRIIDVIQKSIIYKTEIKHIESLHFSNNYLFVGYYGPVIDVIHIKNPELSGYIKLPEKDFKPHLTAVEIIYLYNTLLYCATDEKLYIMHFEPK